MQKWIMFSLFLVACILGVGVLFQNITVRQAEMASEKAEAGKTLKIAASNFQFDKPEYTVKAGDKLTVSFNNKEGLHAMEIVGLNVKLDASNKSQEVTFDKPGTYEIHCILPCGTGHANMKSTLIVQ
ncbi:cupredoxin domain-containing protein [Paenibacillus hamazuiensis]|uniref:cupredoxin domain-containing protein n=1 Tax=Paenibacillus hamazuiensis TaxID=2936508 RepID=UPI00200C2564